MLVDLGGWCGSVGREGEGERVGLGGASRGEDEVAEGKCGDLGEAGSGEDEGAVAGVNFDGGDVGGFGEGAGGEIVCFGLAVLLDGKVEVAGGDGVLKRQGELEEIGLIGLGCWGEGDGEVGDTPCRTGGDGVDAGAAGGGDEELRGATGDKVG